MPEYEISLTFKGHYDDAADAFEHGDMVAATAERKHPDIAVDVTLAEVGP
jgi:hypothetical protein